MKYDIFDHSIHFILVSIMVFFLFLGLGILMTIDCSKTGINIGMNTEYHFIGGGCLVHTENGVVPYDRWIINTGN